MERSTRHIGRSDIPAPGRNDRGRETRADGMGVHSAALARSDSVQAGPSRSRLVQRKNTRYQVRSPKSKSKKKVHGPWLPRRSQAKAGPSRSRLVLKIKRFNQNRAAGGPLVTLYRAEDWGCWSAIVACSLAYSGRGEYISLSWRRRFGEEPDSGSVRGEKQPLFNNVRRHGKFVF